MNKIILLLSVITAVTAYGYYPYQMYFNQDPRMSAYGQQGIQAAYLAAQQQQMLQQQLLQQQLMGQRGYGGFGYQDPYQQQLLRQQMMMQQYPGMGYQQSMYSPFYTHGGIHARSTPPTQPFPQGQQPSLPPKKE